MLPRCNRFDGDCVENNPDTMMDKSKPWNRSIEDLHRGSTLPSPITGNGITRAGRHSTLRYDAHNKLTLFVKNTLKRAYLYGFIRQLCLLDLFF